MIETVVTAGCFPDVTANGGRFWMIARLGDPRFDGAVAIFTWTGDELEAMREIWREALPPASPCFPHIRQHLDKLWFTFHDGKKGHLRSASHEFRKVLDPCEGNDPICFGFGWMAWQGAGAAGYPITRRDLVTGEEVPAGNGAGTGLSHITEDGTVILVDDDRTRIPGGTRPCWAWDLVVVEKHGNKGALARLTDGREKVLWDDVQIITPRCTYDSSPASQTYAIAAHASDDGLLRVATVTQADFVVVTPPVEPPSDPPVDPPVEPPSMDILETLRNVRDKYSQTRPLTRNELGALLNEVAWIHRDEGVGLEAKSGGWTAIQPRTSIEIGSDILRFKDDIGRDVLKDSEGLATVQWGDPGPADPARFVIPVDPVGVTPPVDPPVDPPEDPPTGEVTNAQLMAAVRELQGEFRRVFR